MSERRYEWGDKVWVNWVWTRFPGIIVVPGDKPIISYRTGQNEYPSGCVYPCEITPREDDEPKGWRLPEAGDTVHVLNHKSKFFGDFKKIDLVDWRESQPIMIEDESFNKSQVNLVRLHDDPEPATDHIADASKKVEPTPEPVAKHDPVNHPSHYTSHPSGVECIAITEHENFCIGNAIKYLWRAGEKGHKIEDLEKAAWYVNREIQRLKALEARNGVD